MQANAQIRTAVRRSQREQEACMQSIVNESSSAVWEQLAPLLDEAMASLGDTDRNILALRYFENKTAQEIGRALTLNEQTAQKRANRALEKLRKFFTKRGVSSTTAVMAGAISANSVQAAPVALAKSVTAVAIVKGAAASASTLTLIKGASGGGLVRCRRPPAWPGTQRRPLPFNRQDFAGVHDRQWRCRYRHLTCPSETAPQRAGQGWRKGQPDHPAWSRP